jgi:hypothetical protein
MVTMADDKRVAMKMVIDGKVRDVTFEELAITNNLAQRALVSLLIKNKVIDPKDYVDELKITQKEHYRTGEPPE